MDYDPLRKVRGDADIQAPGTVIAGKYRVERVLGSGGMGVVLAVRHTQLEELYALKLMLPAAAASPAARERFAREAKAAAKLRSEHVARAIDFGFVEDDGPPYMVLELLTGHNLSERLVSDGPIDAKHVASWMLQACDALREAHEDGIIHRDLKPSNLFLTRRSGDAACLKVLDFGIAKTIAADAGALTKTATTMGSPFYMSPEQMRSAKSADARSDIWSLGVTMYELTTGRVPFLGETVTEVAIAVIECAVESPRVHRPDLPEDFERIVMRCLEKQPARRFASVDHLAQALAAFTGAPWSMRPNAAAELASSHGSSPSLATSDALALTDEAPSAAGSAASASSQADTIAASPVLTLLGSSSRDGASSGSNESGSVDPIAKPATPVASRSGRRSWLVPVGAGAAALALAVLFLFRGIPAADQAPPSLPAATVDESPLAATTVSSMAAAQSPIAETTFESQGSSTAEQSVASAAAEPPETEYGYGPPPSGASTFGGTPARTATAKPPALFKPADNKLPAPPRRKDKQSSYSMSNEDKQPPEPQVQEQRQEPAAPTPK